MYLRHIQRKKNGKEHSYWSIVESRRLADGRVSQRHVLYLGKIGQQARRIWVMDRGIPTEEILAEMRCGPTICNWSRSSRPFAISRVTWRSGRSSTNSRRGSRRTSS